MFKKAILAAATTLAIAGGVLGASAGSASASDVTIRLGDGHRYDHRYDGPGYGPRRERFCKPIFKNVRVYRHHHWEWKRVKVGERCGWRRW